MTNPTRHSVIDSIENRYSPYRFSSEPVPQELLAQCFEAASWAASSYNEQPWRFLLAGRENATEFERMLGCLLEANQDWAKNAGALVLTAFRSKFTQNEKPNRVALHDLGQAVAHFALQATKLGLQVHQMAGVNLSQVRTEYQIPDPFEPATAFAIGFPAQAAPESETEKQYANREQSARKRNPISEQLYQGKWGNSVQWG
ncbi:nitroreductase family protein [Rhodopirellula sp. MGV]|uniref:nitroreductase family protein n=1 Tax=Rhodopirellula sp. MGV TaxID=2023130 RepID=UPI000B95ECDE|nr:nitroreductase family protein [Rhodopirellula sp. MGV]OYP33112.1 NAD(P)H-flavin oxidoreductase [Rhodopirellula sp. MGV]PNY35157.1 NAD(P)H-flavin oxidoreductase [Rhodopirellula baltica]